METPRTAEGGHGVSATPARPGGRAMPGSYPGPGLPKVLPAGAASGMFSGQLLARCSSRAHPHSAVGVCTALVPALGQWWDLPQWTAALPALLRGRPTPAALGTP